MYIAAKKNRKLCIKLEYNRTNQPFGVEAGEGGKTGIGVRSERRLSTSLWRWFWQVDVTGELSRSLRRESISLLVVVPHSLLLPASLAEEHGDYGNILARCFVSAPLLYDEKHKEVPGMPSSSSPYARSILTYEMKLSRKDGTSKNKETKLSASNNNQTQPQSLPPPPPPKPNTNPTTSQQSISPLNPRSSSPSSANSINYAQGSSRYIGGPGTTSALAPPIVVVSPDPSPPETIERTSLTGEPVPSRTSTLSRLRSGPKDMIPVKPPRKQRSSRFVITEKVEIEKLPPFMGLSRVSVVARNWRELTLFRRRDVACRASTALRQEASPMRSPFRF